MYIDCMLESRGGFCLIWPIRGCAAGQRMVFVLSVLNSVHDLCESVLIINRVFHARSDNKIEDVVLNRVRVSNPQRLTYTQILVEYPPPPYPGLEFDM